MGDAALKLVVDLKTARKCSGWRMPPVSSPSGFYDAKQSLHHEC